MQKNNFFQPDAKEKLVAETISWVLNPALLGIIVLVMGVLRSEMNSNVRVGWFIAVTTLDIILPAYFYFFFLKRGYIFDGPLSNKSIHRNRIIIFLVFLLIIALQILILVSTNPFQPLLMILTGGLIAAAVGTIITYFWKASMHAGLVTIFVLMIIYLYGVEKTWLVIVLVPLVFWSRMILTRHTFWQLVGGTFVAALIVYFTLFIYRMI